MLLDINNLDLKYYSIHELDLGTLLYEIWNRGGSKLIKQVPVTVEFPDYFSEVPTQFRKFDIVYLSREYGEEEGEQEIRFVFKTPSVDYFEFIVKLSSWDGPFHEGPTPVYPKQTTIYVTKEEYNGAS